MGVGTGSRPGTMAGSWGAGGGQWGGGVGGRGRLVGRHQERPLGVHVQSVRYRHLVLQAPSSGITAICIR